ncbi:unnamed protein product, partial [Rotaria magnacalcarata]
MRVLTGGVFGDVIGDV